MQHIQGWVEQGNTKVSTSGIKSTTLVQGSFPGATVTVFTTGTLTLATIYADNNLTPLSNPFTADVNGVWRFYADGIYDVQFSGGGLTAPFTLARLGLSAANVTFDNLTATNATISGTLTAGDVDATDIDTQTLTAVSETVSGTLTAGTVAATANITTPAETVSGTLTAGTISATTYIGLPTAGSNLGIYNVKDYGAKGDGVTNDTAAIQTTINTAGTQSVIWFPPGQYLVTSQLNVTQARVYLMGGGQQTSILLFQPTTNGQICLKIALTGAGDLVQGGILGLTIFSSDTNFQKVGIQLGSTSSYLIRDVFIWGGSTYWTDPTGKSVALWIGGREVGTVYNYYAYADIPIQIGALVPGAVMGLDMWNFADMTLSSNFNNPDIYVQDNVALTNINFTGRQDWSTGTYGFFWVNSIGSSSYYALNFQNVRVEQSAGTTGWAFYIGFIGQAVPISAISRTGGVATVTVPINSPFIVGKRVIITGVADTSFNGNYNIQSYNAATGILTFNKGGVASSSGGTAAPAGNANCREITFSNIYLSTGAVNGFHLDNCIAVAMTNVGYFGTGVSLNVDTTSSSFIFLNVSLGGLPPSFGTPPFTSFLSTVGGKLSIGTLDSTSLINIPYNSAIAALNSSGVSKRLIGLGVAIPGVDNLVDIDTDAIGTVMGGQLRIGGYTGPVSSATGVVLPNNTPLQGANAAGTGSIQICDVDTSNNVGLAPAGNIVAVYGPMVMGSGGRFQLNQGNTIASASTIFLGTFGNSFTVTGTTTISAMDITNWQTGSVVYLIFQGVLNIGHGIGGAGQFLLRGGANITTSANSCYGFILNGTSWYQID